MIVADKIVIVTEEMLRDRDEKYLGAARDKILAFIGEHEQEMHDGGCCLEERVNAIAFLAHSLGLSAGCDETWELIRKIQLLVYEAHHDGTSI